MEGEDKNETKEEWHVYEVGLLIVPTVAEEAVSREVVALKARVEDAGAVVISEEFPAMRPLAFRMEKTIGAKKEKFDRAYFGWLKIELDPEILPMLSDHLSKNENILRFLLIKTLRDTPHHVPKSPTVIKEKLPPSEEEAKIAADEALDRSIEELVA